MVTPTQDFEPLTARPARAGRRRRVTLLDIARHTGLSRTTVSDILNRPDAAHLYADETRRRVADAVRGLGYSVHTGAQKLARGRSNLIGLVLLRDFANPYFARLADAVDREVRRRGMRLQLAVRNCDGDDEAECARRDAELVAQMQADAVEGLLLGPVYEELDLSQHGALLRGRLPTVLFGGSASQPLDCVAEDADAGRGLSIDHLAGLGHRRIGFLCAPPSRTDPTRADHLPVLRQLRRSGRFAGAEWVAWHPDAGDLDGYAEAAGSWADQWLAADPADRPTAVLTLNDAAAVAALGVFARRGVRVPADLSVVGYDNLPESGHLVPPLTTVDNDVAGQVGRAVGRLVGRIADPSLPHEQITVAPRLVARGSTAPPQTP